MALNATFNAGLDQSSIRAFTAVRIELPASQTINLIDGSGQVTFMANGSPVTFTSKDSIYGVLSSISAITEAFATSAPRVQIGILPPSSAAIGALAAPLTQGSKVYIWVGMINEETGSVVGSPELLWIGRLDVAKTTSSANSRVIELDSASAFDRLFIALESERLNKNWHRSIWPDESGLDYNVAALVDPMWGADAGKPQAGSTGYGGGSTGGTGNGGYSGGYGGGGGRFNDVDSYLY